MLHQFLSVLLSPLLEEHVVWTLEDPAFVCATILLRFALNVANASVHLKYRLKPAELALKSATWLPKQSLMLLRRGFPCQGDTATTGAYATFSSGLPSPSPVPGGRDTWEISRRTAVASCGAFGPRGLHRNFRRLRSAMQSMRSEHDVDRLLRSCARACKLGSIRMGSHRGATRDTHTHAPHAHTHTRTHTPQCTPQSNDRWAFKNYDFGRPFTQASPRARLSVKKQMATLVSLGLPKGTFDADFQGTVKVSRKHCGRQSLLQGGGRDLIKAPLPFTCCLQGPFLPHLGG